MTRFALRIAFGFAIASLGACGSILAAGGDDDGANGAGDAGVTADSTSDTTNATAASDATEVPAADDSGEAGDASEGGVDAKCRVLVADSFDDVDASMQRWKFSGTARVLNGEAEIVPNAGSKTGAIWFDVADAGTGILHATFTSTIPANGGEADGLTFAWSSTPSPTLGTTGGNLAICYGNANALAVALESFYEQVNLVDTANNNCVWSGDTATQSIFGTNSVDISVFGTKIDLRIGTKYFPFTSSRTVAVRAVGFTASTGGYWTRHAVDDVRIEMCAP